MKRAVYTNVSAPDIVITVESLHKGEADDKLAPLVKEKRKEVQKDNATHSRKKLHQLHREAACEEGEPRSPSFTKRTYHCKLGGAGEVFTTKLLAYGREGLSGMTERP